MDKPPKHIVPYGIAGTGKSYFAATLPTPQWIAMFDAIGKETPYTDGTFVDTYDGVPFEEQPYSLIVNGNRIFIPTWDCFADADCKILKRRIVWFQDPDNTNPQAYNAYCEVQPRMEKIFRALGISTFILDSITSMCVALRNKFSAEFPMGSEKTQIENSARGWANRATDELEWVNQFINSLSINTATICHSFYDTTPGRNQELPQVGVHAYGRMRERFLITSGDVYRSFFDGQYKVSVSADALHVGNNSMKINGVFPNDWKEISKADKTNVTFVQRRRD